MFKRFLPLALLVPLCVGLSCTITVPGDDDDDGGNGPGYVQLDHVTAKFTITSTTVGDTATVQATLESAGRTVDLKSGQEVKVNGSPLVGPDGDGAYTVTVPVAAIYTIRVSEPTLGVQSTEVPAPADFAITDPQADAAVSLAEGFDLAWSNPDANLSCRVRLTQTLDGQRREDLGPFADAGSLTITADDLASFRQGATLSIRLTRTATVADLAGLAAGSSARVLLSETIGVVPAP